MKKQISAIRLFFSDKISLGLFLSVVIIAIIDFVVWKDHFKNSDFFVYSRIGIYPIRFLVIILLLNFALSFAGRDEKGVTYLFLGTSLLISILIFMLEILYLTNI